MGVTLALVLAALAALLATPGPAPAASPARLAWLSTAVPPASDVAAFRKALTTQGWTDGVKVVVHVREGLVAPESLRAAAQELERLEPDVVVAIGVRAVQAAKEAMPATPIVMLVNGIDPMEARLIGGYSRPGGNVTGVMVLPEQLVPKRLELLRRALPALSRAAVLVEAGDPASAVQARETRKAAETRGVQVAVIEVREPADYEAAFAAAGRARAQALVVPGAPALHRDHRRIVELAVRHRLPAIYDRREIVEAGGLMSYGPVAAALQRRLAGYVDKILRGRKPGDLVVDEASSFEFAVNPRAAAAIGLALPEPLLLRADHLIR